VAIPIRVYVVDDHDDVREALVTHLRAAPDLLVVGETGGAEKAILEIKDLRPDVVLVETKRGDGRGLEIVSWISHSGFGGHIVVLTSYPSEWEEWAAHRAGAAYYLLKEIGSPRLMEEIRRAAV
jgi:DNA-binding NarL/FixJ family response regulator